jgi:NAD(P)H-dependent FMN reductase
MKSILIINGSLRGSSGNCARMAERAMTEFARQENVNASILTLADPMPPIGAVRHLLEAAQGFLVLSGVYWNSWGSPLQRFLEVATVFENAPSFFGKPIACVVTMDSVGGADIAARIHASFAGLGCWSPPCSTLVVSRIGEFAVAQTRGSEDDPNEDVWRMDDLDVVVRNLVAATALRGAWTSWEKVSLEINNGAWPEAGSLDLGSPRFL